MLLVNHTLQCILHIGTFYHFLVSISFTLTPFLTNTMELKQKFHQEDNIPLLFLITLCWVLDPHAVIAGPSPSSPNQYISIYKYIYIPHSCPPLFQPSSILFTAGTKLHRPHEEWLLSLQIEPTSCPNSYCYSALVLIVPLLWVFSASHIGDRAHFGLTICKDEHPSHASCIYCFRCVSPMSTWWF